MPWVAQSAPCHIWLPSYMRSVAWLHPVGSPHLYYHAYEWSAGLALHYSSLPTHLTGHNDVACPHILQASMTLTHVPWNHVSGPWNHASAP
jgi:hypothetical protein